MILGIVQARCGSTRLPGKVLKEILGRPMLARQIERLQRATALDELIVATSTENADSAIEELCKILGLACYRGSHTDVLDRFYRASADRGAEHVVRLTGDCPLSDPELVDRVIRTHLGQSCDYTSNVLERTYPDGLDVEVFRFSCLEQAWREAQLPSQREHVTRFFYENPERFRLGSVRGETDLSGHRWTVDEAEDFRFVAAVYEALYPHNAAFSTADILELLERRPDLLGGGDSAQGSR
jgi:spore coat polysaccharide biosynthesis protein SpsF